jgi:hypothetical protein
MDTWLYLFYSESKSRATSAVLELKNHVMDNEICSVLNIAVRWVSMGCPYAKFLQNITYIYIYIFWFVTQCGLTHGN